jgi:hypothetical protein
MDWRERLSSRYFTPTFFRSLLLSIALSVGYAQTSFAAMPKKPLAAADDLRLILTEEGFSSSESERVLKALRSGYTVQQMKDHFEWLKKHETKDIKKFILSFPGFFLYSIDTNLDPTFFELNAHWGIGIDQIEEKPRLLSASLSKLQKLRALLSKVASLAGDTQFTLSHFPLTKRKNLIMVITVEKLIQRLQNIGVVGPEKNDLSNLDNSERERLSKLYKEGELERLLVEADDIGSTKLKTLTHFSSDSSPTQSKSRRTEVRKPKSADLQQVRRESLSAALRREGFTEYEVERVLRTFSNGFLPPGSENVIQFLKNQEPKDLKLLILSYPKVLTLSVEKNLEPKLNELKTYWGIGITEIEKSGMTLTSSLSRIQDLRKLLNNIAKIAGDDHFVFKYEDEEHSIKQRLTLVNEVSADQIIQRLKDIGALRPEKQELSLLNNFERSALNALYRSRKLQDLFTPGAKLKPKTAQNILQFVSKANTQSLQDDLDSFLKANGFAYIERKDIIERTVSDSESIERVKNYIEWFDREDVHDTEVITRTLRNLLRRSSKDIDDKVTLLQKHGARNIGKMFSTYPYLANLSIEINLEPNLHELLEEWKLEITDIEKSPDLLGDDLNRIRELRLFLDKAAKFNSGAYFDPEDFSVEQRKHLIQHVAPDKVLQMLKSTRVIDTSRTSLSELTLKEQSDVAKLYRSGRLIRSLTPAKLRPINETKNYKRLVSWLKQQGVENPENFISVYGNRYSLENRRVAKLLELIDNWGYKFNEIKNAHDLLRRMDLERVQDVRRFFNQIANLAGDHHFDLTALSNAQKKTLIGTKINKDSLFERLKDFIVPEDRAKRKKLTELTDSEKALVVKFYEKKRGKLIEILARETRIPLVKSPEIKCEVQFLRQKLQVQ